MAIERALLCGWVLCGATLPPAAAQDPEAVFHRAYYLEKEEGSLPEAQKLYEEVARSPAAPPELVKRAEKRLSILKQRLRSSDLARLMPPEVLAYVEIQRPGQHLSRLLKLAGFLDPQGVPEVAVPAGPGRPPIVVSPRLLKTLDEIDGAALAITEVDPRQPPRGVAILHTGRSDLAHGLIETALSGAAASEALRPAEAVEGHPAYQTPLGTLVITEELVIAGNPRELAVEAVRKLHSDAEPSLSSLPAFSELRARRAGSLAFGFLDGKRAVALARMAVARGDELPREYLILQAVADVESLEWAALDLGTREDGLAARFSFRLREGNQSLAYHLLRTPPSGRGALRAVPAGAAAALALGLDEASGGTPPARAEPAPALTVTGLDLGRELFANVIAVLAYALPPAGAAEGRGAPIPDAGIIFLVKDPSRSEALWKELLRVPAAVFRAEPDPVGSEEIEGQEVQVYAFPEDLRVYLASVSSRVVLATSRAAAAAALKAARGEGSILEDPGLAGPLGQIDEQASKIIVVHGGRALAMLEPWMPPAQAARIAPLLERATLSLSTRELPTGLDLSVEVSAPGLGPLIQQLIQEARPDRRRRAPAMRPGAAKPSAPASGAVKEKRKGK